MENEKLIDCPACGVRLAGRWCHDCGQDTHARPRPLREWASEAFSETNLIDGRTARTLAALAMAPGRLLVAYRDGASALYQTPTKLFVVMTALFLLTLNFADVAIYQHVVRVIDPNQPVVAIARPDGISVDLVNVLQSDEWMQRLVEPSIDPVVTDVLLEAAANATNEKDRQNFLYDNQSNQEQLLVSERLASWLPNALWLLMPIYAVLLKPFFRRRLFMEHLVFAMWAHVMAFALLILLALVNKLGAGLPVWPLVGPYLAYFTVAARRYYDVSWPQALWRGTLHWAIYLFLVLAPAAIVVAITAMDFGAFWAYFNA